MFDIVLYQPEIPPNTGNVMRLCANAGCRLHLIRPLVEKHGAELVMHPFNLGYVFRHHNYVLMEEPRAKLSNRGRDLRRWAERYDLPFRMPDQFPIKTSGALQAE